MTNTKKQQGFSLIETMLVLSVSIVVVLIFSEYLSKSFRSIKFVEEFSNAVDSASKGAESMNKLIREATSPTSGNFAIISAEDNELIFYGDSDNDGQIERLRFFIDTIDKTKLKKGVIEPTGNPAVYTATETISIIAQYVQNTEMTSPTALFTYFDFSGGTAVSVNDIKLIHTHLEINETPERAPKNFTIDSNIHLRNLK